MKSYNSCLNRNVDNKKINILHKNAIVVYP